MLPGLDVDALRDERLRERIDAARMDLEAAHEIAVREEGLSIHGNRLRIGRRVPRLPVEDRRGRCHLELDRKAVFVVDGDDVVRDVDVADVAFRAHADTDCDQGAVVLIARGDTHEFALRAEQCGDGGDAREVLDVGVDLLAVDVIDDGAVLCVGTDRERHIGGVFRLRRYGRVGGQVLGHREGRGHAADRNGHVVAVHWAMMKAGWLRSNSRSTRAVWVEDTVTGCTQFTLIGSVRFPLVVAPRIWMLAGSIGAAAGAAKPVSGFDEVMSVTSPGFALTVMIAPT